MKFTPETVVGVEFRYCNSKYIVKSVNTEHRMTLINVRADGTVELFKDNVTYEWLNGAKDVTIIFVPYYNPFLTLFPIINYKNIS